MDVSPKLLREVEFREQWRGYNQDEVDEFLERLAVVLEQLHTQVQDATDRADRAEQRLLESSTSEDELRRTLVLAQRTADAARQEAEAEAKQILDDARTEARRLVAEARARAARVDREARDAARAELEQLVSARQALAADVDMLERFLSERRSSLRGALDDWQRALDDPARMGAAQAPALTDVDVPEPLPAVEETDDDAADVVDGDVAAAAQESGDRGPEEPVGDATEAHPAARPVPEDDRAEPANPTFSELVALSDDEDAWTSFATRDDDDDDDPFLAELRRAVNDPEPLGPRDHVRLEEGASGDDVELYGQDLAPSSRFRLRRRR